MTGYSQLNAYKETRIQTAGQGELILMLYDGAINQIKLASDLFSTGHQNFDKINVAILKAQNIITELIVSLDFENGGQIAKELYSLYFFFNDQLKLANMTKESRTLLVIANMLEELRTAWAEVAHQAPANQMASIGINISR